MKMSGMASRTNREAGAARAWAFYRRSSDLQEVSVELQKNECQKMAGELGATIVREFAPRKGYGSGLTIDRDPIFLEMVREAEKPGHGVKYLFMLNVSRFGRLQPEEKIFWEVRFRRAGIQIVYVQDKFTNDGSIGDVVTKIVKHSEAHEYSAKLSVNTLNGCIRHASVGRSCGGVPPYGYARLLVDEAGKPIGILKRGQRKAQKLHRIIWVPGDPLEVKTVRRVFDMFDAGIGLWSITNTLNKEGVPSPRGGKWGKSAVRYLLLNEAYTGVRIYNKRDYRSWRHGTHMVMKSKDEWVRCEEAHEPLISKEQFERVKGRFKTRTTKMGKSTLSPYLLSSVVYCRACGHRYQGSRNWHLKHSKLYYICGGYRIKGRFVCGGYSTPVETFDNFVMGQIRSMVESMEAKAKLQEFVREAVEEQFSVNLQSSLEALLEAERQNEKQIKNVIEAIKNGVASPTVQEELAKLEAQKARLEGLLDEERRKDGLKVDLDKITEEIMHYLENWESVLSCGTPEEKKAFVQGFLHKAVVRPEDPSADFYFYRVPFAQKKIAERAKNALGYIRVENIAGVGFEPTTSRLCLPATAFAAPP